MGNDANAVYEYDLGNRLTRLTNNIDDTNSITFEYSNYDKVGNRLSMKIDDANAYVFTYDNLYQLTFVDYNDSSSTSYYYDSIGNRTEVDDGSPTTYLRNNLNQYTSVGGTNYSYDNNGNLTEDGLFKFYYDCENRLTDVNDQNDTAVASYIYDYSGRRISKTVYGSPDVTTKYCYDGGQVIAEYDGDIWGHYGDIWGRYLGTLYIFFVAFSTVSCYYDVMARLARVVVPGVPHHITQRGNRRQATFFSEADYAAYLELMAEWCGRCGVAVWAYCLMPNHVHLIVVPESEDGLRRGIGEAHRRYSRRINFREGWRGHLWQGRFASFPMDERYLMLAVRYVELNPVRAKLCRAPWRWRWSSVAAHMAGRNDGLVDVAPLLARVDDWRTYLASGLSSEEANLLRGHERTGRPLGSLAFLKRLETRLGRVLSKKPPGRKPKIKKK